LSDAPRTKTSAGGDMTTRRCTTSILASLAFGVAVAIGASPLRAAATCSSTETPLLDVMVNAGATATNPPAVLDARFLGFIYKSNHAAVSTTWTKTANGATQDQLGTAICGAGQSSTWTALLAKLAALHPGQAGSCHIASVPGYT